MRGAIAAEMAPTSTATSSASVRAFVPHGLRCRGSDRHRGLRGKREIGRRDRAHVERGDAEQFVSGADQRDVKPQMSAQVQLRIVPKTFPRERSVDSDVA